LTSGSDIDPKALSQLSSTSRIKAPEVAFEIPAAVEDRFIGTAPKSIGFEVLKRIESAQR